MLHHIDEKATAERVQTALEQVYREGKTLTKDVGGTETGYRRRFGGCGFGGRWDLKF